ncbi:MAG: hypothetical protein JO306_02975, partial [Gemmatimonadetes bacterium]|nr:hypothetical protein [Gemmatimonadota bacterium]
MLRRSLLALFPLAAAAPLAAQDGVPALQVAPCTIPDLNRPARCGTLQVWENRHTKSGRKIAISFVVLPATGGAAAKDAVAPLAGGPGQAVIPGATYYARELAQVNREHDVVLVDQRGAGGKSHPLNCRFASADTLETYLGAYYPPGRAAACAAELRATS